MLLDNPLNHRELVADVSYLSSHKNRKFCYTPRTVMPVRADVVRFGLFELDLAQGVLMKEGRRIRLQEQPFRILSILLERPGQTVTREQFRQALWTADTFVDFDRSLNAAMAKLRQAARGLG